MRGKASEGNNGSKEDEKKKEETQRRGFTKEEKSFTVHIKASREPWKQEKKS